MNQAKKNKEASQKKNNPAQAQVDDPNDPLELNQQQESVSPTVELNPERLRVAEEVSELFGNEDIVSGVKKFKADSGEKEIALEFANSHIQFLNQIVESDYKKGVERNDAEIRDFISHVNAMLMKKDEYLFSTIITHSPSHYRNIQKRLYTQIKKEEKK